MGVNTLAPHALDCLRYNGPLIRTAPEKCENNDVDASLSTRLVMCIRCALFVLSSVPVLNEWDKYRQFFWASYRTHERRQVSHSQFGIHLQNIKRTEFNPATS